MLLDSDVNEDDDEHNATGGGEINGGTELPNGTESSFAGILVFPVGTDWTDFTIVSLRIAPVSVSNFAASETGSGLEAGAETRLGRLASHRCCPNQAPVPASPNPRSDPLPESFACSLDNLLPALATEGQPNLSLCDESPRDLVS